MNPSETTNTHFRLLSSSPRRREIISGLTGNVSISQSRGEEPRPRQGEDAEAYAVRSAVAKLGTQSGFGAASAEGQSNVGGEYLIAADTVVALDARIFGKPLTETEADDMLRQLRNRRHRVITGVAVMDEKTGDIETGVESSTIVTRDYSDDEIAAYISSGEPFDKAGAYAVQDAQFGPVLSVDGCYLNVVGLPLCLLATLLTRLGASVELRPSDSIPYHDRCTDCRSSGLMPKRVSESRS